VWRIAPGSGSDRSRMRELLGGSDRLVSGVTPGSSSDSSRARARSPVPPGPDRMASRGKPDHFHGLPRSPVIQRWRCLERSRFSPRSLVVTPENSRLKVRPHSNAGMSQEGATAPIMDSSRSTRNDSRLGSACGP
jgi:hypothetical protein